ncbi:DUF2917 domain-containing protein [Rhodoferax sp.]|uniref:DUF2917 domain-containing protein n=1 Tax=Rhodoferax sp. TaxID=50421 RepID=UPI002725A564|nr:DUF2917 domain-containing protein [Rhodoferax sp.]MDO9198898.1 DUF2917 domain-containing protein [Rhodoferax sp.]
MATKNFLELHQPSRSINLSGCWELAPGRAISLQPREAGALRIAQGQVWATVDAPHQGHGNELGDHFLQSGQRLDVRAGQHLVFEPWPLATETPVYFEWTPHPSAVAVSDSRWQLAVIQPLHDLGLALSMAGGALVRLVSGLAGYGEYLVAGRGRVLPKLEANQP